MRNNNQESYPMEVDRSVTANGTTRTHRRRNLKRMRELSEEDRQWNEIRDVVGSAKVEIRQDGLLSRDDSFVYHCQIFDRLVAAAGNNGAHRYVNEEPAYGRTFGDVTAYHAQQKTWAKSLAHRPENLLLWEEPKCLNQIVEEVGFLMFEGQIVLDYTGTPIRAFDIPWTISSAVEGYRVEAWKRADIRMKMTDIVARIYTKVIDGRRLPLIHERGLATRAKRFRQGAGLVSWGTQHAKPEAIAYFDSLRSDAQKNHNLAVQRELIEAERSTYELLTIDSDVDRGDLSAIAQVRREKRMQRFQEKAREDYPEGELLPGARDRGDLFERSVGGSGDRQGGQEGPISSQNQVAASSVSTPSLEIMQEPDYCEITHASRPTVITKDPLGGDEGARIWDSLVNTGWVQEIGPIDPAAAPLQDQQASHFYSGFLPSFSPNGELEDEDDPREIEPTTVEEAEMLQSALVWTIADYHELSGGRIPTQTNPADNYLSQWAALQTQFHFVWRELWNTENAPTLRGLDRWTGGISNWQTAAFARTERDVADEEAVARYFDGTRGYPY